MDIKDVVNALNEKELEALTSIRYVDCEVIELSFQTGFTNYGVSNIVIEFHIDSCDFNIELYDELENKRYNSVDVETFYFAQEIIETLTGLKKENKNE